GMLPPQLAQAYKPSKGQSRRPIVEQLPAISVNDLPIPSPYDPQTYTLPNVSFRYPQLAAVRLSFHIVEFHHPSLHRGQAGPVQTFRLKHIKTGFGVRHAFICTCGRAVIKLYHLHRNLACRRCCNAIYASQTLGKRTRPALQALRIESFLENKPRLSHRTRERLTKKLGQKVVMAQGHMRTRASSLWE